MIVTVISRSNSDDNEEDENEESMLEERSSKNFLRMPSAIGWEVEVALLNPTIIKKAVNLLIQLRIEELDDGVQLYGMEKQEVKLAVECKAAASSYLESFRLMLRVLEENSPKPASASGLTWRNLANQRKGGPKSKKTFSLQKQLSLRRNVSKLSIK